MNNLFFFLQARVNQEQEHFLINPFGLMYHEVTGSSLVKVDIAGKSKILNWRFLLPCFLHRKYY